MNEAFVNEAFVHVHFPTKVGAKGRQTARTYTPTEEGSLSNLGRIKVS